MGIDNWFKMSSKEAVDATKKVAGPEYQGSRFMAQDSKGVVHSADSQADADAAAAQANEGYK